VLEKSHLLACSLVITLLSSRRTSHVDLGFYNVVPHFCLSKLVVVDSPCLLGGGIVTGSRDMGVPEAAGRIVIVLYALLMTWLES
jgi:hypothetical protein